MSAYMKKRKERVVEGAENIVRTLVPQAFGDDADPKMPYEIEHTANGDHVIIDVHVVDRRTTGQLIGKKGSAVKTIRRLLEIIANQEGLRVTFDIIPPVETRR